MFYYVNPTYRYQFFSPDSIGRIPEDTELPTTTNEPKRNLVNALAALYRAYGGEEELINNAVDIIYKIADRVQLTNNASNEPPEEATKD